mmetsp:Transcript_479/g.1045  ORF Transcript_479/g.1045 Transcript_479/m.1045 type:complete len:202 (+) Transcript_479:896-1501(+)
MQSSWSMFMCSRRCLYTFMKSSSPRCCSHRSRSSSIFAADGASPRDARLGAPPAAASCAEIPSRRTIVSSGTSSSCSMMELRACSSSSSIHPSSSSPPSPSSRWCICVITDTMSVSLCPSTRPWYQSSSSSWCRRSPPSYVSNMSVLISSSAAAPPPSIPPSIPRPSSCQAWRCRTGKSASGSGGRASILVVAAMCRRGGQ